MKGSMKTAEKGGGVMRVSLDNYDRLDIMQINVTIALSNFHACLPSKRKGRVN